MGMRRDARERAIQFLFQHDLNPPEDLDRALNEFWDAQHPYALELEKGNALWGEKIELPPLTVEQAAVRVFAEPLIRGVLEHRDEIDVRIQEKATNWKIKRIAAVDRNILRLAIYEMMFREDIPPVVSIDEAVDIAKRFSTDESGAFVNGILDKLRGEILRPARGGK